MASSPSESTRPAEPSRLRRVVRVLVRVCAGLAGALLLLIVVVVAQGWRAFGKSADGARLERMEASPQYGEGIFVNPQVVLNYPDEMMRGLSRRSEHREPEAALPVVTPAPGSYDEPPSSGLRVTWLGHSTILVEIDGRRVLTDPVWSERPSPVPWAGPKRYFDPPLALDALPELDAVVISHDHYDHLDYPTIVELAAMVDERGWDTKFLVPLGVGAHLEYWGVPEARLIELDWWEVFALPGREGELGDGFTITCAPARHASGRHVFDKDATLWAGYALTGPEHRVFFSGDTGLFPAMATIGETLGPFDLTMIEVGAYDRAWPDWHLGPEQAVRAHQLVQGRALLPVHWGLWDLAYHGWTEPMERTLAAAEAVEAAVYSPRPGEAFEVDGQAPEPTRWWPEVPWVSGEDDPIEASGM
ncbi:hypothetical protein PPSIR1_36307 [Plesiocystis pacifica SIR-1]|uniref:Metallo-beta-lactamase domain-containing protein n=1 Tax=Plesiocystis pacifica SIR-1 TaxID=391625 RepID=A6G1G6_9BACT|nr:MBL fold metallo-hydrolase [Plesiocystis pacifica]EDM80230.1 hypothetical protein PPSIR1_36307 [Plesiocystis pacifica SIR-1]